MSYCANCGKEISSGSKFCPHCGNETAANHRESDIKDSFESSPAVSDMGSSDNSPVAVIDAESSNKKFNKRALIVASCILVVALIAIGLIYAFKPTKVDSMTQEDIYKVSELYSLEPKELLSYLEKIDYAFLNADKIMDRWEKGAKLQDDLNVLLNGREVTSRYELLKLSDYGNSWVPNFIFDESGSIIEEAPESMPTSLKEKMVIEAFIITVIFCGSEYVDDVALYNSINHEGMSSHENWNQMVSGIESRLGYSDLNNNEKPKVIFELLEPYQYGSPDDEDEQLRSAKKMLDMIIDKADLNGASVERIYKPSNIDNYYRAITFGIKKIDSKEFFYRCIWNEQDGGNASVMFCSLEDQLKMQNCSDFDEIVEKYDENMERSDWEIIS